MALNDVVAQHIMGELDTLTKLIDEQSVRIAGAKDEINKAAERIKKNSDEAVTHARESARQVQLESFAKFQVQLSKAVSDTLSSVASAIAVKSAVKWVLAGVALAGVLTVTAGWIGFSQGQKAGQAIAYATAKQGAIVNTWVTTGEGQLAYRLYQAGSIRMLANCTGKGWKEKDGTCFPFPSENNVHGWGI